MSKAQLEEFISTVRANPVGLENMSKEHPELPQFIAKLVEHGRNQGFDFSQEEASAWFSENMQARTEGELSDAALEGVAGGVKAVEGCSPSYISTTPF